jgi:hypothetical protein
MFLLINVIALTLFFGGGGEQEEGSVKLRRQIF